MSNIIYVYISLDAVAIMAKPLVERSMGLLLQVSPATFITQSVGRINTYLSIYFIVLSSAGVE